MEKILTFRVGELVPYINWIYFMYAWGMTGKPMDQQQVLKDEALDLLRQMDERYHVYATFALFPAYSEMDDIVIEGRRIPTLRQQVPDPDTGYCLALADFIQPAQDGKPKDMLGIFATTVDHGMESDYHDDDYLGMMAQTLADRLAEAAAEVMHMQVRTQYWGYAPHEKLTIEQMHQEQFQGIRPAVGYPSLPDTSVNFLLQEIIPMREIGIRLTESGAMKPHASVSGLMMAHPKARYFHLGQIGEDQLADYARRRGLPLPMMRRFLATKINL